MTNLLTSEKYQDYHFQISLTRGFLKAAPMPADVNTTRQLAPCSAFYTVSFETLTILFKIYYIYSAQKVSKHFKFFIRVSFIVIVSVCYSFNSLFTAGKSCLTMSFLMSRFLWKQLYSLLLLYIECMYVFLIWQQYGNIKVIHYHKHPSIRIRNTTSAGNNFTHTSQSIRRKFTTGTAT